MADFSPTKFDFGSQIQRRREAETAKGQAEAKAFAESLKQGHDDTVARIGELREAAGEIKTRGGTDEQIDTARNAIFALAKSFGDRLDQGSAFAAQAGRGSEVPAGAGDEFVDTQMQLFETSIEAAQLQREDTSEDFETVPPEEVAKLGFPEGAIVQRGPDNQVSLTFDPSTSLSAFQEKVDALTPFVGEEFAVGIAAGRFVVSTNPITNESVVLDKATGEVVGEVKQPPPASDVPSESDVPSLIPSDIETDVATGLPGALKNAANIIKDAVGAGAAFPEAQKATEALNSVQVLTTITLQAEVPGRPSVFLLERLEGLTVSPNSLLQGETRAKTRLEQTRRLLDGEIQRMEKEVLPLELDPKTRVETQLNLTQMKRLRTAYDDLLKGFDKQEEEIDPELEALLDKHAPLETEEES